MTLTYCILTRMAQWLFIVCFIIYTPHAFGINCYLCQNETDLTQCCTRTECPTTEICKANRIPNGSGGFLYTLGCIPKNICDMYIFGRRSTPLTGCCNTDYCNNKIFNQGDLHANATNTSSLLTTTTQPSTTTGIHVPRRCHQCGDTQGGHSCTIEQITTPQLMDCPDSQHHFCMTDVIQDDHGNADMYKRCATDYQCRKDWVLETAGEDFCTKYGVVKNPYAFQCHFCCTTDGCNTNIVPDQSTWYMKP